MAIIYWQLFVAASMLATRLIVPRMLLIVACGWTVFSLFTLFYLPLMALQLLVTWASYAILRDSRKREA